MLHGMNERSTLAKGNQVREEKKQAICRWSPVVENSPKLQLLLEARLAVVFEKEAYLDYCYRVEVIVVITYFLMVSVLLLILRHALVSMTDTTT
jgi:hypothetical protein